jgi:hypothetical protein
LAKINSKVPVEINSSISCMTVVAAVLDIHVLSLRNNLVIFVPAIFDEGNTVDIKDGNEVKLVVLEKLLVMGIALNYTLEHEFEHLVDIETGRNELSGMSSTRQQNSWLVLDTVVWHIDSNVLDLTTLVTATDRVNLHDAWEGRLHFVHEFVDIAE